MCFHSSLSLQSWTLRESARQDETGLIIRRDFKGRENNFSMAAIVRGVMRLKWQSFPACTVLANSSYKHVCRFCVSDESQWSGFVHRSNVIYWESKYTIKQPTSNWVKVVQWRVHFFYSHHNDSKHSLDFKPSDGSCKSAFLLLVHKEAFCHYLEDTLHSNYGAKLLQIYESGNVTIGSKASCLKDINISLAWSEWQVDSVTEIVSRLQRAAIAFCMKVPVRQETRWRRGRYPGRITPPLTGIKRLYWAARIKYFLIVILCFGKLYIATTHQ